MAVTEPNMQWGGGGAVGLKAKAQLALSEPLWTTCSRRKWRRQMGFLCDMAKYLYFFQYQSVLWAMLEIDPF